MDSTPVIIFTGQQPLTHLGKGAFQEINHTAIFSPITKWSTMLVKPEKAIEVMRESFKATTWGRPGPVHIDLPLDVQNQSVECSEEEIAKEVSAALSPPKPYGDPYAISKALKLLVESSKPVIIAGGGVYYSSRASKEIRELAEYLNVPVATTFNGRGSFPEDHPLSIGRIGIHSSSLADRVLAESDLIIAVGCRFAALSTREWRNISPAARLIHIDIDLMVIGRNYPVEIGIVGDAKTVLSQLLNLAKSLHDLGREKRAEWLKFIECAREE
ncbi:MAG: thiamine pyrophosphate-binding protein [Candidatus Bathyarchaeia archaeon]